MRYRLICHPDTPALTGIVVSCAVRRQANVLTLGFRATGPMAQVQWPGQATGGHGPWVRRDELWRHSCFEVFGRIAGATEYYEGNFATSGEWAAYGFSAPRSNMRDADEIGLCTANWRKQPVRVDLNAMIELPPEIAKEDWQLALSAVIEEIEGTKSYWALAHPPGPPDFHHDACFALEVPATG